MTEANHTNTVTRFADLMDRRFTIPGTNIRYGIDALLSLIPGVGDWLSGVLSTYVLVVAAFEGISVPVMIRMFLNIIVDITIGSIPLAGDLFDVSWRANTRNAKLFQQYQRDPEATQTRSRWMLWSLLALFVLIILGFLYGIGWLFVQLL